MTQPGETDAYTVRDHVQALLSHMDTAIDWVIVDNNTFPPEVMARYLEYKSELVTYDPNLKVDYKVLRHDVVSVEDGLIRHDSDKIRASFEKVLELI